MLLLQHTYQTTTWELFGVIIERVEFSQSPTPTQEGEEVEGKVVVYSPHFLGGPSLPRPFPPLLLRARSLALAAHSRWFLNLGKGEMGEEECNNKGAKATSFLLLPFHGTIPSFLSLLQTWGWRADGRSGNGSHSVGRSGPEREEELFRKLVRETFGIKKGTTTTLLMKTFRKTFREPASTRLQTRPRPLIRNFKFERERELYKGFFSAFFHQQ